MHKSVQLFTFGFKCNSLTHTWSKHSKEGQLSSKEKCWFTLQIQSRHNQAQIFWRAPSLMYYWNSEEHQTLWTVSDDDDESDISKLHCWWAGRSLRPWVRSKEALQTEVWVISQQTWTCGLGRGSPHPHFGSPTLPHTGSLNQHTNTQVIMHPHVKTCTGTHSGEKNFCWRFQSRPSNSPPAAAQWWPTPGAHKHSPPREKEG